jgi:(2Fe-2S) ferredoxin
MYKAHLFICTNHPLGTDGKPLPGKCGVKGSDLLLQKVKDLGKNESWGKQVRINKSGCLGQCEHGIACVLYPKNQWFLDTDANAAAELVHAVNSALTKS